MIIFLLLVIIAILLLGASRFLGVVTAVFGFAVAIVATAVGLGWMASALNLDSGDLLIYVLLASLPALVGWAIVSSAHKPKQPPSPFTKMPAAPQKFVPADPLSREKRKAIRRKLRGLE